MLDQQTTDVRIRRSLAALGFCLILGMPAAAAGQDEASGPQRTAAQVSSSPPAGLSQPSGGGATWTSLSTDYAAALPASTSSDAAAAGPSAPTGAPRSAAASNSDAGWTPGTAINSWLPHWLRVSGEFRDRMEGHTAYGFKPGVNDEFDLTRVRLGLDFTPTSWFHAFVQARDSEAIGEGNAAHITTSMRDVFDLNQGYLEFRNGEKGWFGLKVGRQELQFGDQRLLGVSNWSNASRSWDAVRLTLGSDNVGPWLGNIGAHLDVFAGSVVKNYYTSWDHVQAGRNLYGFNLALTKIVPKATIEPYVYLKTVPTVTAVDKTKGNERLYTSGVRFAGTIPGGFDYRLRYSRQSGHFADSSISAWAGYGVLGYTIPGTRYQPRFSIEYNYASGNKAIGSPTVGTFDLLYPTTHQWDRITDLFGEANIRDLKPGFDFRPVRKLKVRFVYSDLHLASKYDSLYDTTGAALVKVPKGGALSTHIGQETDVYGTYDVNKRLQIGAGFGHLIAGEFLKQNTRGASASYPYGFVDYNF